MSIYHIDFSCTEESRFLFKTFKSMQFFVLSINTRKLLPLFFLFKQCFFFFFTDFCFFPFLQTFYQIRRIPGHWEEKCFCTSGLTVNLVSNPNVTVANYSKKLYSPPSSTHKEPTVYGPVIKLFKCFFFFLNGGSFNH